MKRCLFFCILWVITVLSGALPPLTGTASADTNSDAAAFCKSIEPYNGKFPDGSIQAPVSNNLYDSCVTGYVAEKNNNSLGEAAYCRSLSITSFGDCEKGWEGAQHNTPPTPPGKGGGGLTTEAVVCGPFGGDKLTFCQRALENQCSSYTAAHTTSTLTQQATDCFNGAWAKHNGKTNTCGSNAACNHGYTSTSAPAGPPPNPQLGCEIQLANALSWIICPVTFVLTETVNALDSLITQQLTVNTNAIFCTTAGSSCDAYYQAWQSFRDIALGLMAIAGLIVISAQALGLEILDAYTLRKVLPRLLVAAIGITLSWPLMRFLINFSNDLGFGIRHLIYAPFSGLNNQLDLSFGGGIVGTLFGNVGGAAAAVAAVPAWIVTGGPAALLAFLGTAILAVLVALAVLILRQVVIILFVLISPIAIVAYVLPNTQRIYRMWWDNFFKALMMFPLIAAMIATGRVFSAVAINNGGFLNSVIGFAAYFAPYFMIPLTFKMAGGAVSGLSGVVQSRAQGGFAALRGVRANQRKNRFERARGRGLYRAGPDSKGIARLGHYMNKIGSYTVDADETLPYLAGTKGGRVGNALFGRMAAEAGGIKAHQFTEQTAKGVEQANMHYSAAWGALGMRKHLAKGMTEEGLKEMDTKYGIDADGNRTAESGKEAVSWQPPPNADHHGLVEYGHTLAHAGVAGSDAQFGGEQLVEKAGILSSFGNSMETQRASLGSVAALTAAREGKLSSEDIAGIYNHQVRAARASGEDPTEMAFAADQMAQLQNISSQQRHSARFGKGVRLDENGEAYSVYSQQQIKQEDGSTIEAYKTEEAANSLETAKAGAIGAGKGEYYDETRDAYVYHGGSADTVPKADDGSVDISKLTPRQREIRKSLAVQYGPYGPADPGAKQKLEQTLNAMGITAEERMLYMREVDPSAAASGAAGGPAPVDPSAGGGGAGGTGTP